MQSRVSRKIGIFGGSFNPVHNGHLQLARMAKQFAHLDLVLFVPNYQSPFKSDSSPVSIAQRIFMLELALAPYPDFLVSLVESSPQIHYTCDTIETLGRCYPHDQLFFLAGEDILHGLSQWKNFPSWISKILFIIVPRGENRSLPPDLSKYEKYFSFIDTTPISISSSQIRKSLSRQEKISSVPKEISDYIRSAKLYQRS